MVTLKLTRDQITIKFSHSCIGIKIASVHGKIIKISLLEANNSINDLDIIALSDIMLKSGTSNDEINIEGFSNDIFRSNHPSNAKVVGACIYFRHGLPIGAEMSSNYCKKW